MGNEMSVAHPTVVAPVGRPRLSAPRFKNAPHGEFLSAAVSSQHTESDSAYAAAPAPASVSGVPSPRGWRYCAALPPPCHSSLLFVSLYYLCPFDHFYVRLERESEREFSNCDPPSPSSLHCILVRCGCIAGRWVCTAIRTGVSPLPEELQLLKY
jgi:hypothetical protein